MLDDEKIEEMKKMYIDSEFSIKIFKVKGRENTTQIYNGTKTGNCYLHSKYDRAINKKQNIFA